MFSLVSLLSLIQNDGLLLYFLPEWTNLAIIECLLLLYELLKLFFSLFILRWLLSRCKVFEIDVKLLLRYYEWVISSLKHLDFILISLLRKFVFSDYFKDSLWSSLASRLFLAWLVKLNLLEVCNLKLSLKPSCNAVTLASRTAHHTHILNFLFQFIYFLL